VLTNDSRAGAEPDIADPAFFAEGEPSTFWEEARATRPVSWVESRHAGGFWSVFAYAPASQVLKLPAVFTSSQGMRLGGDPGAVRMASGRMLTVSDGRRHQIVRAALMPWFTCRGVAELRDRLQQRLDACVAQLVEDGRPVEIVATLAKRFPAWTVFEMMGIPAADWDRLAALTDTAYNEAHSGPARRAAQAQVLWYFTQLLERRRADPRDDIVSALLQANVEGDTLSDEEILLNCDGLVIGGLETTQHAASGAVLAFAAHPGEWARVRAHDELLEPAVEEVLRWTSPAMHVMRTALVDASVADHAIPAGDRLAMWIPSCNRDTQVFGDAGAFRVDRRPNPHLSFSVGPHYCIGAPLARLELGCYLRALARSVAGFETIGDPVRLKSNFLNGLARLEVRLHR
jgi:cytochrome P450